MPCAILMMRTPVSILVVIQALLNTFTKGILNSQVSFDCNHR